MTRPRVAIAHDYLTQRGGAERVVLSLARAFPDAPIYTTFYDPDATYPEFADHTIITSPLNKIAFFKRDPRRALAVLAQASSALRVDADVVIASSSGWAHGFGGDGRRLIYCHAPARWLYQTDAYLGEAGRWSAKRLAIGALRSRLIQWDQRAASLADRYLANSRVVSSRIEEAYGIHADVLPPPFGVSDVGARQAVPDLADWAETGFLLVVSRLLPYKNVDAVVQAVEGTVHNLVVVGAGPERERLGQLASGNVRFVSGLTDAEIRWTYAHARLLIGPSYEDFGLTPLEANSFGVPVVALRAGGYLDTVVEGVTGSHFDLPEVGAIRNAVDAALGHPWDSGTLREHAQSFGDDRFADRIQREVEALWRD
ncbi:glycosyltransferase [Ornithinimicrobium sp. Y1847]|uniref:glycosyltransferase n=1 Tax=Ornithinimicrobium sp. Y1847 TaxID=3405419 RepID=UPI003B685930